ncbi:hypothetical protein E4U43_000789 [Claviceps pusilla]|uniref:Triosephosphate isomerase n=1 Tax=Claviceps pusilla TaxID=123648 RepID=A0A9P7NA49_9HYPO|nr:hypothetical protein E4U43_000789 [Claviceps pusilla]
MTSSSPRPRRLIGLSTKMYFSLSHTRQVTASLLHHLASVPPSALSHVDIFLMPDFVALAETAGQIRDSGVGVWAGAQNCHWEDSGAYTGEVSASVLREVGVRIVEVGHAERRRIFGEDAEVVASKAAAVSRNGMIPLVCVGEQRKAHVGEAIEECRAQVEGVLGAVASTAEVAIAYEPVWAIGATEPAGEEHVLRVVEGIRELECVRTREGVTRIVYGGSAGPGLYARLKHGLDGLFLGRFGHDPASFVRTVREVAEA